MTGGRLGRTAPSALLCAQPVAFVRIAAQVRQWMDRWPDGMDEGVQAVRRANKERMVPLLVRRIEQRPASLRHYVFSSGMTAEEKRRQVLEWWNEIHFQLVMAAKTPEELNALLGGVLSAGTLDIYRRAQAKGIPIFVTPYYLSLLDPSGRGYDDAAIRSYVIYSSRLVEAFRAVWNCRRIFVVVVSVCFELTKRNTF